MRKADVIIPTFKPGDKLEKLLRRLLEQSVPVGRVIIMNTEEKYWDAERFESLFEERYKADRVPYPPVGI